MGTGVTLPELGQGPWDMEAAGVLGLAHRREVTAGVAGCAGVG